MPEHRTLVVSDTHLCAVAADDDAWMPYRTRAFQFDDALAMLLRRADRAAGDASLLVVFNGDTFDFDAPDPGRGWQPTNAAPDVPARARAIVRDHPAWADAVAALLARRDESRRVVFVGGNHDAALARPDVRDAVREAIGAPVGFATLCVRTDDGLFHVEHGHQYDPPCALACLLPDATGAVEPTVGSIVSQHAPSILGCVNPFGADPLAVTPRALWRTVRGCGEPDRVRPLRQLAELGAMTRRLAALDPRRTEAMEAAMAAAVAHELHVSRVTAARHVALFAHKVDMRWLAAAQPESDHAPVVAGVIRATARRIAALYGCRGAVFGHTHVPAAGWDRGVFYGNTGTWAPAGERAAQSPVGHFAWLASGRAGVTAGVYPFAARPEGPLS